MTVASREPKSGREGCISSPVNEWLADGLCAHDVRRGKRSKCSRDATRNPRVAA
jgi:hypothetical protein